jgi:hypothetical protein
MAWLESLTTLEMQRFFVRRGGLRITAKDTGLQRGSVFSLLLAYTLAGTAASRRNFADSSGGVGLM